VVSEPREEQKPPPLKTEMNTIEPRMVVPEESLSPIFKDMRESTYLNGVRYSEAELIKDQ
jgi:hypothetical protein